MSAHRRGPAVAVGLTVLGAVLALLAVGRPWAHATVLEPPAPPATVSPSGRDLSPASAALALAALAGAVAVLAARRTGRVVAGLVLALVGAGIVVASMRVTADLAGAVAADAGRSVGRDTARPTTLDRTWWPEVCAAGGIAVTAAGLLTALRGRRWATLSSRYDAPAGRRERPAAGPAGMWDAIDEGHDPTA